MPIPVDQRYTVIPSYFFKGVFKHCHSLSGAIYARLFSLQSTKEGCTGACYTTISHLEEEFGEKRYAITQALNRLKDCGLITTQIEKWSQGKRTRVFFNLKHEYLFEGNDKGTLKTNVSGDVDNHNTPMGGYVENQRMGDVDNQRMGYVDNHNTPMGGYVDNQRMGYVENQRQDTDILSTELFGTDCFSTEGAKAQKTTPQPLNINQPPKDIKYPTTLEETLTFFEPAYNDALQDFPELKEIDMRISADKFLNYWRSKGWKDVFNLSLKARWWLIDALEKLKKDKSRRTYSKRYTSPEQRAQKKLDAEAIFDKYYSDKATEVPETDFVVVEDEDDDDKDKNRSNGSSGAPAMLEMEI